MSKTQFGKIFTIYTFYNALSLSLSCVPDNQSFSVNYEYYCGCEKKKQEKKHVRQTSISMRLVTLAKVKVLVSITFM